METRGITQLLFTLTILFCSAGYIFKGASADYAPEKMGFDDEARQEMILEPRSSIPHPRASVPEPPVTITELPTPSHDEINEENSGSGSGSQTSEEDAEEENEENTTSDGLNQASKNDTTEQPVAPQLPTSTSASNSSVASSFSLQPANQSLSSNEVSHTDNQIKPASVLQTADAYEGINVNSPVKNAENIITPQSISFGMPSKPLTQIKAAAQDIHKVVEENKEEHTITEQANDTTSYKPIITAINDTTNNSTSSVATGETDATNLTNVKIKDNSVPKEDIDMESGSGSDEQEETSPNYAVHEKDSHYDASEEIHDEEDEDEDDSGSGEEDHPLLHKNHTLTSTNGPLKLNTKTEKAKEESVDEDKDDENEDAFDKGKEDDEEDEEDHDEEEGKENKISKTPHQQDLVNQNKDEEFENANNYEAYENKLQMQNVSAIKDTTTVKVPQHTPQHAQYEAKNVSMVKTLLKTEIKNNKTLVKTSMHKEQETNMKHYTAKTTKTANTVNTAKTANTVNTAHTTKTANTVNTAHTAKTANTVNTAHTAKTAKTVNTAHTPNTPNNAKTAHTAAKIAKTAHTAKTTKTPNTAHTPNNAKTAHTAKPKKSMKAAHIQRLQTIQHNKKQVKPKKPLFKYIHRTNLHSHPVVHVNKTKPQTCNSDEIKTGFSLKGGTRAGHVEDLGGSASMHECIKRCCHKHVCDVALLLDGRCFGVACYSKELCEPIPVPHPRYVASQIAFLDQAQRRTEVERARPEFDCKYGELAIRNNHRWTGELCGGVVSCKNGVISVEKCAGIPPKPKYCANPKLSVKQRPGQCCIKKWQCKDKSCWYGGRQIPHGVSLSDPLCTGVVTCMNGHLKTTICPGIPNKPTNCANPRLKVITKPGKCCKKKWVCQDKSCMYNKIKVDHGERLTDASCAVIMECKNGFLNFKQCPGPPAIPHGCLNPTLSVKRILGDCCHMKWTCAPEI